MFKPKSAKTDYTRAMLPHTRKEVFFDVVKLHFRELLLCGVIVLVFSLPMHLLTLLEDGYVSTINAQLPENPTEEQLRAAYDSVRAFGNFKAIVDAVLLLIFSIGFSGLMRVIRQYAWGENVFFTTDFFKGIRQNIKQTLLLALIIGILYAVCVLYYNAAPQDPGAVSYMFLIPVGLFILLVIPIAAYMTVCIPVYTNSFGQNAFMGLYLFVKSPLKTYGALIACGAVFISYLFSSVYAHLLGRLFCSFAAPFVMLAWYLFAYNRLDRFVNEKEHPELVGRGTV